MSKEFFENILDACLDRLQAGESIESCLESYPKAAGRLEPLLRAAEHSRSIPKPEATQEAREQGLERVLIATENLQGHHKPMLPSAEAAVRRFLGRVDAWLTGLFTIKKEKTDMKLTYRVAILASLLVLIGGFFTINASAGSLPGEPLYEVKRGWEQTRLALAFDEEFQQSLEDKFKEERLEEVSTVLDEKITTNVEFEATIESMDSELWNIGGFNVLVDQDTELKGNLTVGSRVQVEGITQEDGSILAVEIESLSAEEDYDYEEMEAYGTLESMSGSSLVVDGMTYLITPETEFDDEVETGDYVSVEYYENQDGDLILLEIELEDYDYEEMEAYGTLESMTEGSLVVDGMTYLITPETEFDDEVETGDYVSVEYYENQDGDLILLEIELEDYNYEEMEAYGTLESMSGSSLVVDGMTYLITPETEFDDEVETGDYVSVEYYENQDGDLILLEIELEDYDYEEMEAYGTLESMTEGSLVVDGMTYLITPETEFDDEVETGDYVSVEYYENQDGDLILLEIELEDDDDDDDSEDYDYEEMEAYGTLESMSGSSLVVNGMTYLITSETEFDDEVETGDYVSVEYYEDQDGDLILVEIELEDDDDD